MANICEGKELTEAEIDSIVAEIFERTNIVEEEGE